MDCTLGGGGHTKELLRRGGRVIGLDQDTDAIQVSSTSLSEYITNKTFEIAQINFRHLERYLQTSSFTKDHVVDGILLDLGISSHQIDESSRGFAFSAEGPLDMRMAQQGSTSRELTAAHIVNEYSVESIANILYEYGEEMKSRQIAREIVASRPLHTTKDLAMCISKITPWKHRTQTLARCFQALRIVVNDEMSALNEILLSAHRCLRPGNRIYI